jgi:hypothetical protein
MKTHYIMGLKKTTCHPFSLEMKNAITNGIPLYRLIKTIS